MDITQLLKLGVHHNASDLHLSADNPPLIRVDGEIQLLNDSVLSHKAVQELIFDVMNEQQRSQYEQELELDFSFELAQVSRFRVNAFWQNRGSAAVFRTIPERVLTLEQLDAPDVFKRLVSHTTGLILVTGATGSGKSTTLAAMVDHINKTQRHHILTIEDPIEFVHHNQLSLVNQREVQRHTKSFSNALRSALREDPDVILVGELRDLETIRLAITAAETGHLVLGTLHTSGAAKTIDRIIDVFPAGEKAMVRSMLSESLNAVISQRLVKRMDKGRVAAHEILIANSAIRNLIREDKVPQMQSVLQTGSSQGMQTMQQALQKLAATGQIDSNDLME